MRRLSNPPSSLPVTALAILAALCFVAAPRAAVLSAEASLGSTRVVTGEAFQLTVRVVADKRENLPWPTVEGLEPFTVSKTTGTSSSSQTTIINGTVSRSESYVTDFIYLLTAREAGSYTVGPIRYAHKDFERDLGRASVTVTKAEAGISTRASMSKQRAYAGEQVFYNLHITSSDAVQSINLPKDFQKRVGDKFFFQMLDSAIERRTATVDGREVPVYDVRIALFPLIAGPAVLEGIPIEYRRIRPGAQESQSMFDAFFGNGAPLITQTAIAAPLRLQVTPLPAGAPSDFTGSVGQYSLKASLDKSSTAAGEPITLTVTIRGNGQPKSITRPVLPDLPGFEVYDPEESGTSAPEGSTLWTTRTFKYVLIPSREGNATVGAVSFPYFDPARGAYVRAESQPLAVHVTPGKPGATPSPYLGGRAIADLGGDIRHIKAGGTGKEGRLRDDADLPYRHATFFFLALLAPVAFFAALFLRRRADRLRTDVAWSRRTRASGALRRRLKDARQAMESGRSREFYRALSEAVMAFPSDKLNREFRGLTFSDAAAALAAKGAAPESVEAYDTLLQRCDLVQFAGLSPTAEEMSRDLGSAEALLERLDKELA
jgi:hypothetical protein